jgi:hypothetical protein
LLLVSACSGGKYLDLYRPADLDKVIRERVAPMSPGQIFTYAYARSGEEGMRRLWMTMSTELNYQLEQRRYAYVVLAPSEAACDEVMASAAALGGLINPLCVLDSLLSKTHGYEPNRIESLWVCRYHICGLFSRAGVGCTLLDIDVIIRHDVLALLRAYEAHYSLIILREGRDANGGVWHLRASPPHGAGLWIIEQIERRSTMYSKWKVHDEQQRDPGFRQDQDTLADVLRVAATAGRYGSANASAFDFWGEFERTEQKGHPLWQRLPQREPAPHPGWTSSVEKHSSPFLLDPCPWQDTDAARCERLRAFEAHWHLRDVPLESYPIAVPWDAEVFSEAAAPERILSAPLWLFCHGDTTADDFDDQAALIHLTWTHLRWRAKAAGSQVGKLVQWAARVGLQTLRLPPDALFVSIAQPVVDAAAGHSDEVHLKFVMKHLAAYAAAEGAVIVLPSFDCGSPWIRRGERSRTGVSDHRVVVAADGRCYPSPAGYNSCFLGEHFVFPWMLATEHRVVELNATPALRKVGEEHAFRRDCPDYFEL